MKLNRILFFQVKKCLDIWTVKVTAIINYKIFMLFILKSSGNVKISKNISSCLSINGKSFNFKHLQLNILSFIYFLFCLCLMNSSLHIDWGFILIYAHTFYDHQFIIKIIETDTFIECYRNISICIYLAEFKIIAYVNPNQILERNSECIWNMLLNL